jgi:hypothetical protein
MDRRIGRYSDGLTATTRARARVGHFADGIAVLGAGPNEGRFSTGMERAAPKPEPRRIRRRETAPPWRDAA